MRTEDINIRDPFVLPFEGKYYLYGTRGDTAFKRKAYGLDVYVSEDLKEWTGPKEVFHKTEDFWADRCFWAPEVYYYKDGFYMFATFSNGKKQGTSILRSDSPEGPFRLWSGNTATPERWSCLDGTLFLEDGVPYMVFCHEWKQVKDGEICAVRLSEDLKEALGEPELLFSASSAGKLVKSFLFGSYVTDGPFFYRSENGRLHLLWSSYGKKGYVQLLAHSDNDRLYGNWKTDEVLYTNDGGHGMIFRSFDDELYLTLHTPNTPRKEHPVFIRLHDKDGKPEREETL